MMREKTDGAVEESSEKVAKTEKRKRKKEEQQEKMVKSVRAPPNRGNTTVNSVAIFDFGPLLPDVLVLR